MSWLLHDGCGPREDRHLANIFVRHENLRINGFGGENAHRSSFRRTRCGLKQSARRGEVAICTLLAPFQKRSPRREDRAENCGSRGAEPNAISDSQ